MITVDDRGAWGRQGRADRGEFLVREAVGLEVRKTPIRIAEVRSALRGLSVGLNRLRRATQCLERVRDREAHFGVLRRAVEQPTVERKRLFMPAKTNQVRGREHAQLAAARIIFEQLRKLLLGVLILVKLDQDVGELQPRRTVAGRPLQDRLQQQLRVIEDLARDADAGQQPHCLHVIAVGDQPCAHQRLRDFQITVFEKPDGGEDLCGHLAQSGQMAGSGVGILGLPEHAVQALEHAPCPRQCVVALDGLQERINGGGSLAQLNEAATAFLV